MKKILLLALFFTFNNLYSQLEGKYGFTAGATNYITDSNLVFSKSGTGFTVGLVGTAEFDDFFRLIIEMDYNEHAVKFVGREEYTSDPVDLKFKMTNFSLPILLDYDFYEYDNFVFSGQAGPAVSFYYGYSLKDETKEDYLLEPFYASPTYLDFDKWSDKMSLNLFAAAGLSATYEEQYRLTFRYYYGITDPYRNASLVAIEKLEGQDSYFQLTFTYFLGF
ncbi:porin family protein [Zunongwangia sp. H14]|uniref:porin family protein n=1 Tax=Zunongwangia sp. H14 TaxID=3240792 RepID=UPI003564CC3C